MTTKTQIDKWKALQAAQRQAAALERAADKALDDFVTEHLRDYPLSPAACNALRDHVRMGGSLCCTEGSAFVATVVDPIWAPIVSEWAYESLGCKKGRHVEDDLLRLNKFLLRPRGA